MNQPDPCRHADGTNVFLHHAWMWDCPHCGTENFQRAVTVKTSDEELRASGVDEEDLDKFRVSTTSPCRVRCKDCGNQFNAVDDLDDEAGDLPEEPQ
jgi:predicted  nucleic acid-binding Zn-ribbon protein